MFDVEGNDRGGRGNEDSGWQSGESRRNQRDGSRTLMYGWFLGGGTLPSLVVSGKEREMGSDAGR